MQDDELLDAYSRAVMQTLERTRGGVVALKMQARRGRRNVEGAGSGFLITPDGYLVTNSHVADAGEHISVTLDDGSEHPAQKVGRDVDTDLALLRIGSVAALPHLELGVSASLRVGQVVIAIGNPQGHANTVTRGVLSATDRDIAAGTPDGGVLQLKGLLQTDAAINQGNSGGALLDITGKLIGINNAMAANAENIGFAIPVNTVQRVFNELLIGSTGYTSWLGMRLDEKDGALTVAAVDAIGPAARAGLQVGDQLVAAGDKRVASAVDYARALVGAEPGRAFSLSVRRGNRELALKPVPQPRAAGTIANAIGAQVEEVREDESLLREASDAFSHRLMRRYRLPVAVRITHVAESSPAAALELQPNDVLLYWQQRGALGSRQPFDGMDGLANLLTMARGQSLRIAILRNGEVLEGPLSVR